MKLSYSIFISLLSLGLLFSNKESCAQGIANIEYGKNRVQHKNFEWYYYQTEKIDLYHYIGGKALARFAASKAEAHLEELEKKLDYRSPERLTLIIYNSQSDLDQTNLGLAGADDNPGGITPIIENKAYVYFNGNHFDFISSLREAIAEVLINEMLFGGTIQERVQNSALIQMPDWYLKGLVSYLAQPWSYEDEGRLRSGILSKRFKFFSRLPNADKKFVAKAMWKYINDQYGDAAASNIIYLTRINKSLENGYVYVLNKGFNELFDEWYDYFRFRYVNEVDIGTKQPEFEEDFSKLFKGKGKLSQFTVSEDGKKAAYVKNHMGKKRIWIYDFEKNKRKRLKTIGYKQDPLDLDFSYPLIEFNPRQNNLVYIYEKKSRPIIEVYDYEKNKVTVSRTIFRVEKIRDFSVSETGRLMALSAIKNGQSDIYVFNLQSNSLKAVTNDEFDDLNPIFINNDQEIVFSSNRTTQELNLRRRSVRDNSTALSKSFDLYLHHYKLNSNRLHRLTFTPWADESEPQYLQKGVVLYKTGENGIINLNLAEKDSAFSHTEVTIKYNDTAFGTVDTFIFNTKDPKEVYISDLLINSGAIEKIDTQKVFVDTSETHSLTNFKDNLNFYTYSNRRKKIYANFKPDEENELAILHFDSLVKNYTEKPILPITKEIREVKSIRTVSNEEKITPPNVSSEISKPVKVANEDSLAIEKAGYYFQNLYPETVDTTQPERSIAVREKKEKAQKAEIEKIDNLGPSRVYYTSFTPEFVQTQVDNSLFNTPYQPYQGNNSSANRPFNNLLNGMVRLGIKDVFNDYRISGGFRVHGNLRGMDYFLNFDNLKKRLDKRLMFFRQGEKVELSQTVVRRETSHELRGRLTWPFSETSSVSGDAFTRFDENTYLSSERSTLEREGSLRNWAGLKLQYIKDNCLSLGRNLWQGTKFKVYSELWRAFDLAGEQTTNTLFYTIGTDARHSFRLFNDVVWANRLAGATSLGDANVVYIMGGVDNWLIPQYNSDINIDDDQNYVYRTLATNLRGFSQNIRNGSSYGVFNSELRVPIFRLFYMKPLRSNFFENFQLIGFSDFGTAWTGNNPFANDNALNKREIQDGNVNITVINLTSPIVGGYGLGVRSLLLGYFVRLDFAWGIQDFQPNNQLRTYISIGTDF